tara:strand:- start:4003 stop:4908 length:906 start_codon:yes stop_codon:yes gene_type:complete
MTTRNLLDDIRKRRLGTTQFRKSTPRTPRKLRNIAPIKIIKTGNTNIASTIGKVVVVILILVALGWGTFFLYKRFSKKNGTKNLLNYSVPANMPFVINNKNIPKSEYGNEYTLSYWFYVNDWSFKNKQPKSLLYRGDTNAIATNPGFWFFPEDNKLKIAFQLQSFQPTLSQVNLAEDCPNSMNPIHNPNFLSDHKGTCNISNVPLQRWNHICVSIWNQSVDVYLNGKLVRSCVMHEYPVPSSGNIYIGSNEGFNGRISSVQYFPTIITPEAIYNIYKKGPVTTQKDTEVESNTGAVQATTL